MLLDTQFIIDLQREVQAARVGPARTFLGTHRQRPVWVSIVSFGEVAAGMTRSEQAREFFARSGFRMVALKPEMALRAAELDRHLQDEGARLGENDNWIAGTALYCGLSLVTNDPDFDRVPGLRRLHF